MTDLSAKSDGELVAAVRAGESAGLAELVRRYRPAMLRMARSRMGDPLAAEDVVQETLLCVVKFLHTYDSRYSLRTWLWTILLNQCRRHHRRAGRTPHVHSWSSAPTADVELVGPANVAGREPEPQQNVLARERAAQLEKLLDQLPEPQADALRLRFYGELKFHEIAETMGCSLSSAKNRVRWGLERISQLLGDSHSTRTNNSLAANAESLNATVTGRHAFGSAAQRSDTDRAAWTGAVMPGDAP